VKMRIAVEPPNRLAANLLPAAIALTTIAPSQAGEWRMQGKRTILVSVLLGPVLLSAAAKQDQHIQAQRSIQYTSRSADDAKAWQQDVRARLSQLLKMDDLTAKKSPIAFNPKEMSSADRGTYRIEEVEINSTVNRRIRIIVTSPTSQKGPFPAVVCIGGHGSSLYSPYDEYTVPKDSAKAESDCIYKAFGTVLAKRGYVTISTTVSQHEIYEEGRLLMGERLWDLIRCVDYLESMPDVDRSRIGCAGLSLGGEMAMWLGAMDERLSATVSAGFLTTMDHMEQNHWHVLEVSRAKRPRRLC
jgi:hypothetical protein